jgi:hypothetical protein
MPQAWSWVCKCKAIVVKWGVYSLLDRLQKTPTDATAMKNLKSVQETFMDQGVRDECGPAFRELLEAGLARSEAPNYSFLTWIRRVRNPESFCIFGLQHRGCSSLTLLFLRWRFLLSVNFFVCGFVGFCVFRRAPIFLNIDLGDGKVRKDFRLARQRCRRVRARSPRRRGRPIVQQSVHARFN